MLLLKILVACWLAVLQDWTTANTIESLSAACASGFGSRKQIRLSARGAASAATLLFDVSERGVEPRSCGVDVHAPNTHVISLHLVRLSPLRDRSSESMGGVYQSPCPLAVFSLAKGGRTPRRHLRSVDMCDAAAVEQFSAVFDRHHLALVWMPPFGNFSRRLQASELVVTALGSGPGACKTTAHHVQFPCWRHTWYSTYCVAGELVCDGKRNCPEGGGDEDPQLCATLGVVHPERRNRTTQAADSGLDVTHQAATINETSSSNNLVNVSSVTGEGSFSFPASLGQYGPWGFVMLGTLICGSMLMLCGLWECCCRRYKAPNTAPTSPQTVFIINSAGQTEEVSSPSLSAPPPPSYEDLDQPPAYSSLFPTLTCKSGVETNGQHFSEETPSSSARY